MLVPTRSRSSLTCRRFGQLFLSLFSSIQLPSFLRRTRNVSTSPSSVTPLPQNEEPPTNRPSTANLTSQNVQALPSKEQLTDSLAVTALSEQLRKLIAEYAVPPETKKYTNEFEATIEVDIKPCDKESLLRLCLDYSKDYWRLTYDIGINRWSKNYDDYQKNFTAAEIVIKKKFEETDDLETLQDLTILHYTNFYKLREELEQREAAQNITNRVEADDGIGIYDFYKRDPDKYKDPFRGDW